MLFDRLLPTSVFGIPTVLLVIVYSEVQWLEPGAVDEK